MRFTLPLLAIAFLFASHIRAESLGDEIWDNIKSPVTTSARYSLYTGTAITLTLVLFDKQLVDPTQEESVKHKILGEWSPWGDQFGQLYPNAAYSLGMLAHGWLASDKDSLRNSSLMFQATLYSSIAATALKYTIRQPRPNNSSRRNSFPSGHATTIFALASYVGCRHPLPYGIAAYSLAGFVAYSRMNDNAHYLHDVTGGATLGIAYGYGVCMAEMKRTGAELERKTIGYLIPTDDGIGAGLVHRF